MSGRLAPCLRPVVARRTRGCDPAVVKSRGAPRQGDVTTVALKSRRDVICGLARRGCVVMTGAAGAEYLVVVNAHRVPHRWRVTSLATIVSSQMGR